MEKIAYSSISEVVSLKDIITTLLQGLRGGGIESRADFAGISQIAILRQKYMFDNDRSLLYNNLMN